MHFIIHRLCIGIIAQTMIHDEGSLLYEIRLCTCLYGQCCENELTNLDSRRIHIELSFRLYGNPGQLEIFNSPTLVLTLYAFAHGFGTTVLCKTLKHEQ